LVASNAPRSLGRTKYRNGPWVVVECDTRGEDISKTSKIMTGKEVNWEGGARKKNGGQKGLRNTPRKRTGWMGGLTGGPRPGCADV